MTSVRANTKPVPRRTLTRVRVPMAKGAVAISSSFDSGNIKVLDCTDTKDIKLEIHKEPFTEGTDKRHHFQWFYFRVANAKGKECKYRITNAHAASFSPAYDGYKVAYSYDPSSASPTWTRVAETDYKPSKAGAEKELVWSFKSEQDSVWFAYFAPFSYERHQSLIATCAKNPLAEASVIGSTLQGRPMDLIKIGEGDRKVWVIARQHPGESMAEWFMDGFLKEIMSDSKEAKALRKGATVYAVPNMNPDGSVLGHLRTNACGANLNREWQSIPLYPGYVAPSDERSPEVKSVLDKMIETGVDLFIDVHGDEQIDDNFFAGSQGIPHWSSRLEDLYVLLNHAVLKCTKEFQVGKGYGDDDDPTFRAKNSKKDEANLSVASNHVAHRFDCLSATLEMPFKDTTKTADVKEGWNPVRAQGFGASMVGAFVPLLPVLRGDIGEEGRQWLAHAKDELKDEGTDWYQEGK
eukprot:CAMPEP_0167776586 /NCGR_PEP_ID=MMETSP0111_2-20121227/3209_1 /TAXON_ID=91324 /ORGANISM="Lotharella globosa, Strain CCCM811" /LENGTH=464 /DNA_ID=CAMNT_0007666653 /DNA_START=18 /DNA_END=1412 /DNA_ORIENTATION=+